MITVEKRVLDSPQPIKNIWITVFNKIVKCSGGDFQHWHRIVALSCLMTNPYSTGPRTFTQLTPRTPATMYRSEWRTMTGNNKIIVIHGNAFSKPTPLQKKKWKRFERNLEDIRNWIVKSLKPSSSISDLFQVPYFWFARFTLTVWFYFGKTCPLGLSLNNQI